MIGRTYLEILCASYFAMLGFIWMLVDCVCNIITPLRNSDNIANPTQNVSDKPTDESPFENSLIEKLNDVQMVSPRKSKSTLTSACKTLSASELRVNPEVSYLSRQRLIPASNSVTPERRLVLKRPHENISYKKFLNLMVVKNSFNSHKESKNNLIYSIREINKFINGSILAGGTGNALTPMENSHLFPVQAHAVICGKRIKLDADQILVIQNTAHYIINHLDMKQSHLRKQFEKLGISDYFNSNDYSSLRIKPKVTITEVDSNDENEKTTKLKNQRKKKNKKRYRKGKINNLKVESNAVTFSSKQCFERLALFMSTNQGLTQSKMMLEIEKEFKPIKDQICELRETMTDFVVVNHRTTEKGVKTSKLTVKPIERSGQRLKSKFTVSSASASLQKLARLAETSNNPQGDCCQEPITGDQPKKLSPLAEMYIKLSRK